MFMTPFELTKIWEKVVYYFSPKIKYISFSESTYQEDLRNNYNLIKKTITDNNPICLKDSNGNIYQLYQNNGTAFKFRCLDTSTGCDLITISISSNRVGLERKEILYSN